MKDKVNKFLGFDPSQLDALGQYNEFENSYVINVYLAGKIKPNGWRQNIFDMRNSFYCFDEHKLDNEYIKYNDNINIVGPFFLSCDHSCYHGEGNHGLGINCPNGCAGEDTHSENEVVEICTNQIKSSDVVFAYINDDTCYGTLSEIGYAKALGKHIIVIFDTRKRAKNMWFITKLADKVEWGVPVEEIKSYFDETLSKYQRNI